MRLGQPGELLLAMRGRNVCTCTWARHNPPALHAITSDWGLGVQNSIVSRLVNVLFLLTLSAQLGACTSSSNQPRDEVRVRVGTEAERPYRAEPYAALYSSYAMMTSLVYTGREYLNRDLCPDQSLLDRENGAQAIEWMRSLNRRKWQCVFGLSEKLPCPHRYRDCNPRGTPDLQVWKRDNPFCNELVIAFRGVNLMDLSDWSYLRWLLPRIDESESMQARVEGIAAKTGCHRAGKKIIAAGHSLGGGLAEETAYSNGRIRYVYAFNAFPIAGFFTPNSLVRAHNKIGLGVDNVYEAEEILAIPRFLFKGPETSCNPRIRTVQFNLIPFGLPIEKHRIDTLTINLLELSRQGISARSAMGQRPAAQCIEAAAKVKA